MSELRRAIEAIRSALESPDLTMPEPLRRANEVYAEACVQANERLRRCDELLRQGLRTEAIRQSEIEPDLLDRVAELDFAGRDQWEERLMMNDVPVPPMLHRKAIEALSRAYAEETPLEELLKRHRILALSRAPLRERVGIVRLLARAEPTNPAWGEDTLAFEAARMDEMRSELRHVRQSGDWARMSRMNDEVHAKDWSTFLPLDLVSDVEREYRKQARINAEKQIRGYGEMLKRAIDTFDMTNSRRLRKEIADLCEEREISPQDGMLDPVRKLTDWVDEQIRLEKEAEKRDKANRELSDALAQGAELSVLQAVRQRIFDAGYTIKPEVDLAYQQRVWGDGRKKILTTIFVVVALVLMLGCMTGGVALFVIFGRG